ncbi:MAG: hypothetical protein ACRCWY_14075 [Cellulosilyticaceae bacterium]
MSIIKTEIRPKSNNYGDILYPKTSIDMVEGLQTQLNTISINTSNKSPLGHTHDDIYYTENEVDAKLAAKADNHTHPYAASSHSHSVSQITGLTHPVTSVAGRTGAVTLGNTDVGLGNVNNWGATSAVNDASNAKYATAGAVKTAYDKGVEALNLANSGAIKSVQRGVVDGTECTGDSGINGYRYTTITISPVNMQKAFVIADTPVFSGIVEGTYLKRFAACAELISSTTLRIYATSYNYYNNKDIYWANCIWQVIEFL